MDILDILVSAHQGYSDEDDGICAEECGILWGHITASSLLVQYGNNSMVIFSPSKGAAYIAKKQFYRKAKRAGMIKLNPDAVKIGILPDKDIQQNAGNAENIWYASKKASGPR